MHNRAAPLIALCCLTLAACSAETPDGHARLGSQSPKITGGTTDSGHPTAGTLLSGSSACTATLIGNHTVLTAGHCIKSILPTFTTSGASYKAIAVTRHPSYGGGNNNDVAIVVLGEDVAGVTPTPINTQMVTVGQAITLVGYGLSGTGGGFGTKRVGTNTISSVGATTFKFLGNSNVCDGDSGGPTYVEINGEELVAGVHSTRSGSGCGSGGTDMRVDAYQDWIMDTAEGDVALPGTGLPPGGNLPLGPAGEGQSCMNRSCDQGLACTTVFQNDVPVGKTCLEQCTVVGGDPICDGDEVCTESKTAGKVCFSKNDGATGYANLDGGSTSPPPTAPPANPPSDSTPPKVTIDTPATGATVPSNVTVKATVTDDVGVTKVELYVDGNLDSTHAAAPYTFMPGLEPGTHTLKVVGHDAAGNKGQAQVTVTVDGSEGGSSPPSSPQGNDDPSPNPSGPGGTPQPDPGGDGEPVPDGMGEYGASCQDAADCVSNMCAQDPAAAGMYCTQSCDPWQNPCPGSADCLPSNGYEHVCAAPPGTTYADEMLLGGCTTSPVTPAGTGQAWMLLLVLGLLLRGRDLVRRAQSINRS